MTLQAEHARMRSYDWAFFSPPEHPPTRPPGALHSGVDVVPPYLYAEEAILAVNVALATRRPLLIAGPPGSGKSSLARDVKEVLGWRFLQKVITSRTQATDLLSGFDALRRLNDAQLPGRSLLPDAAYVEPGILWWAFDPASARVRGLNQQGSESDLPPGFPLAENPTIGNGAGVVVLLDEIDKAEPDVPNDLLEPLDQYSFTPPHYRDAVCAKGTVLVVITTNGERELPSAFLRRCVLLTLRAPDRPWLLRIAELRFGPKRRELYAQLADWFIAYQTSARERRIREPSTAEYLDAIAACVAPLAEPDDMDLWLRVANTAMWKHESGSPLEQNQPGSR